MKVILALLSVFYFDIAFAQNPQCQSFLALISPFSNSRVEFDHFSIEKTVDDRGLHYIYRSIDLKGGVELRKDSTGITISAQNYEIRESIKKFLDFARGSSAVVFADVNYLGNVNYFYDGAQAGDSYLQAVAEALVLAVGDKGAVFRWGGDEFVIILNTASVEFINSFGDKVVSIIGEKSGQAMNVFRTHSANLVNEYQLIRKANFFSDVPSGLWSKFYAQEVEVARSNFGKFKVDYLMSAKLRFKEHQKKHPSVSMGAALNVDEDVMINAENAAVALKKLYRESKGFDKDLEKYIGRPNLYPSVSKVPIIKKVPNIIIHY